MIAHWIHVCLLNSACETAKNENTYIIHGETADRFSPPKIAVQHTHGENFPRGLNCKWITVVSKLCAGDEDDVGPPSSIALPSLCFHTAS